MPDTSMSPCQQDSKCHFDIVISCGGYRLAAFNETGTEQLGQLPPWYDSMSEAKLAWGAVHDCPICAHQVTSRLGGPDHFGSPRCQCGSPASGGRNSHCSCECCW